MNRARRSLPAGLLFAGAAAVLALVFYRAFVLDGHTMLYGDDMVNEGLQLRAFGVAEIRSGRGFPFWNPFVYGGQPYLAILPGPVFYPTSILYLWLPLHRAIGWSFVIHTFLGGILGYAAARSLRLRPAAAAVSGLAFMFAGFVVSTLYGGHDGRMFAMVLVPAAFGLLERGIATGRVQWFVGLGLVVALQIFTPHIQLMYFSSLALTLYAALRIVQRAKGREGGGVRLGMRLGGLWATAFIIAALVGAAQLIPTVRILDVAVRGGTGESGYAFASSWALPAQELTALFLPDLIGSLGTYWGSNPFKLHTEYLGIVPLTLAAIGLTAVRRDTRAAFLAVIAGVCVLFALGAVTPVHRVAYELVPFVKQFRAPSMMLGPASLMIALLAGLGWQWILEEREGGAKVSWAWAMGILVPVAALGLAAAVVPSGLVNWARTAWYPVNWTRAGAEAPLQALQANGWILLAGLACSLTVAWAVARGRWPRWTVAVLFLVLIGDQWRVDSRYLRTVDPDRLFPTDRVVEHLSTRLEAGERVFLPPGMTRYGPSELSVHRIPSVTGIQKFRLEWYERFTGGLGMSNVPTGAALALLDVAYIVAGPGVEADLLTPEAEAVRGTAYRVELDVPHAFFPRTVEAIADTAAALRRVLSSDPLQVAVVERASTASAGEGTATVRSFDPNEIVLDVRADRGGLLFLSEVYYPAWRAWVDGEEVEILRTNVAFRGLNVPQGTHEVRLRYSAAEFTAGFAISGVSAVAAVISLLIGLRLWRRPRHGESA